MRRPLPKNFDPNIMTPIRGNNPPRIQISPLAPPMSSPGGRGGVADRIRPPSRFDPFGFEKKLLINTLGGQKAAFLKYGSNKEKKIKTNSQDYW